MKLAVKSLLLALALVSELPHLAHAQSPLYHFLTIAGGSPGSLDGTNRDAQFLGPVGLAIGNGRQIYIADADNHTIRKLTAVGTNWVSTTIAGQVGTAGHDDGANNESTFNYPTCVALDGAGNLYITDTHNNTVRQLTPKGTNWLSSTIAGLAGSAGTNDGLNGSARFSAPRGVAVDNSGNVYVADYANSTLRKLTRVGTNWASSTIAGQPGSAGSNDGTNNLARFNYPTGIAVDAAGNVYVSCNQTIRKLTLVGANWVTTTIAGVAGNVGSTDGPNTIARFHNPANIAIDIPGNLYVADVANNTIRKLSPVGTNWISSTIATADFNGPFGVAVDSRGGVFTTDLGNVSIWEGVPPLLLTAPAWLATGEFQFTFMTRLGATYTLQTATMATNWLSLLTISGFGGPLTVTDSDAASRPQTFYRIKIEHY